MHRPLTHLRVGAAETAAAPVLRALRSALDGSGPALAPLPGHGPPPPGPATPDSVPDDVALVVRTSGSTGRAREVMLDAAALLASAHATHDRLGGPGRWVLALPLAHIAGLQVLVRSAVAGTEPVVVPAGRFDPRTAAHAVTRATASGTAYASLVPTQLHRILGAAEADIEPWRRLAAVLVGGAAATRGLLDRARTAGLRVVTTYGMTETCGGCVYDGVPLAGVLVRADDAGVRLAGPVLARGYLGRPDLDAAAFVTEDGVRWLRTQDAGEVSDGVLQVHGRRDDVVVTGGHKVAPAAVEAVLSEVDGVGQVCVVGVPDPEWGQAVTAVVVPAGGAAPPLAALRDAAALTLGAAAAPRHLVVVDGLAERGPGKVDRAAARDQALAALSPAPANRS